MRTAKALGVVAMCLLAAACGGGEAASEGATAPAPGGEQPSPGPVAEGVFSFEAKGKAVVHPAGGSIDVKVAGATGVTYEIDGLPAGIEMKEHSDTSIALAFGAATPELGDHPIKVRAKSGAKVLEAPVLLIVADHPGKLDETFGTKGLAAGASTLTAESMALDPEGRVLVTGYDGTGKQFVSRHAKDGALDKTFDGDGNVIFSFDPALKGTVAGIVAMKDGSVITAGVRWPSMGKADPCVAKLDASGKLDGGFGTGGVACFAALPVLGDVARLLDVVVQADGTLYAIGVAGDTMARDAFVVKLTPKGELDTGYGISGVARFSTPQYEMPTKMAIDGDGRVLVAGGYIDPNEQIVKPFVLRFTSGGTPDPWFGKSGMALGDAGPEGITTVGGVAVAPNGDVFVAGRFDTHGGLFAFESQKGGPLTTFAPTGALTFPTGDSSGLNGIAWDEGKLLATGSKFAANLTTPHALRVTLDGKLDATFGDAGITALPGNDLVAHDVLIAPSSRMVLLLLDGPSYVIARAWR